MYLQRAASVAQRLPSSVATQAFLLGLGIGLDDSDTLLRDSCTTDFSRQVERPAERRARQAALGGPTIRGRRDWARHFFLSAYLTVLVGGPAAESAGVAKELADSRTPSGLSYRDLAANAAGVHFAEQLLNGRLPLEQVAAGFSVRELMPDVADLPEGIPWQELTARRSGPGQEPVGHYHSLIHSRIQQLSPTQSAGDPAPQ
jgi:hypothetical protein